MKSIDSTFLRPQLHPLVTPLCRDVWESKYKWGDESYSGMFDRVAKAIYAKDDAGEIVAYTMMNAGIWMPAGRILAGAGTNKRVTLLNCFVNQDLEDDMASIATGLGNIMLTMQQGGGIGTDFSPLRPPGAILRRTGAVASGPGPFIDTWDSACTTIRSAGDRRGAMMGTLICSHPFLPEFIKAKQTAGRWTNFNVSVLITDEFMGAVQEDQEWILHHSVEPAEQQDPILASYNFTDNDGVLQFAYSVHKARDLWDQILQSTYVYSEPGVIFIDRVNDLNNLNYVEHIQCTNPCGEQPLPAHGCCDLGAVVLSRCVTYPFTEDAEFNWELLDQAVAVGVRFLDNVIDVTNYPLPEQKEEQFAKRRIGLGISGLADAMHMLGMRYGSPKSCEFTERVMQRIANTAYLTSANLAASKGKFPLCDTEKLLQQPFIKKLAPYVQDAIAKAGLRNGVLLTIAPTGTTSIAYGNGSSGLEPVFAHSMRRKVRQADGSWLAYDEISFGARVWLDLNPGKTLDDLPSYMNVCADVKIHEHIRIQEVCQKWVDASISKTINLPEDITYDEFKDVYQLAYDSGLKGCTTYRPSEVRGSILSVESESEAAAVGEPVLALDSKQTIRPEVISSQTAKIKWPGLTSALYLTVGYVNGQPYEIFLNSKDQKSSDWVMALTILMSLVIRNGVPIETLSSEFQQIHALEGGWADGGDGKQKYWPSLIAYIGFKMAQMTSVVQADLLDLDDYGSAAPSSEPLETATPDQKTKTTNMLKMDRCPQCGQYSVTQLSGCLTCTDCGWSKCG